MLRKPIFWIVFFLLSAGATYFAAANFSRAFPIVGLDLRMDRVRALEQARALQETHRFGLAEYEEVASFGGDQSVQNFVELEAGGTEAFQGMIAGGLYHAYQWSVRHFKEGETLETWFRFTPRGDPYGFRVRLPESDPGAAMEAEAAQRVAEGSASADWNVDLSPYDLVEKSQEVRPGGRVDHTFVYERREESIGEGRYRLRLVVGGDRLTELTHFVKVPEAFSRRYEEMRSANTVIGAAGTVAMVVLYVAGGCGFGLYFLLRQRALIWRAPLYWGLLIGFLQLLVSVNQWPLAWIGYDTAVSARNFMLEQILFALLNFVFMTALLSVSFLVAEGLSRRAFPHHIQQWKLWSPGVANSGAVLGRTAGGYLLVGLFFAYEVMLYFTATKAFGWWTPSDILVQPDVLATYFPWLSSIAISAMAGFWEEALFRAVPLAGAALLGSRYGKRGWWIAGAMIVQALIFGAGHAGYANQPAYARVVELIIPSLMFGGIFLYFGLLPAIVLHFAFDVVWFALPLFVSTAPGLWLDRSIVIALTMLPLWMVLLARLRTGRWSSIDASMLNREWRSTETFDVVEAEEKKVERREMHPAVSRYLPVAGLLGLALWAFFSDFRSPAPAIVTTRAEAGTIARQELEQRGIRLGDGWTVVAGLRASPDQQDRFIWQTAGRELYGRILGNYLDPPHWIVRFVQFEGDVAERAEEYRVHIAPDGTVLRFHHRLPEGRAGATIPEEEARQLAHEVLRNRFQKDPESLKEISAVPSRLEGRTDWLFTFSDDASYEIPEGEMRLSVRIAGREVADALKFVHVPEEWAREERNRTAIPQIISIVCIVAVVLAVVAGIGLAIFNWSQGRFAVSTFLALFGLLAVLRIVTLINGLPALEFQFTTDQPYRIQIFLIVGMGALGLVVFAAAVGLVAGFVRRWFAEPAGMSTGSIWILGSSLGALSVGLQAVGSALGPSLSPVWPDYGSLGVFVSPADTALKTAASFLTQSTVAVFMIAAVDKISGGWTRRKGLTGLVVVLLGLVTAGTGSVPTVSSWLLSGAVSGAILLAAYIFVLRFSLRIMTVAIAVALVLSLLKQAMFAAYPGVVLATVFAVALTGLAAWLWPDRLLRSE